MLLTLCSRHEGCFGRFVLVLFLTSHCREGKKEFVNYDLEGHIVITGKGGGIYNLGIVSVRSRSVKRKA